MLTPFYSHSFINKFTYSPLTIHLTLEVHYNQPKACHFLNFDALGRGGSSPPEQNVMIRCTAKVLVFATFGCICTLFLSNETRSPGAC